MAQSLVKSCIISRKGGVPLGELNKDYKELVGEDIPFKASGFQSLKNYLLSIKGITITNDIVVATSDKTAHLEKMINKQKDPKRRLIRKGNSHNKENYSALKHAKPFKNVNVGKEGKAHRKIINCNTSDTKTNNRNTINSHKRNFKQNHFRQHCQYNRPSNCHSQHTNYYNQQQTHYKGNQNSIIPALDVCNQDLPENILNYLSLEYTLYLLLNQALAINLLLSSIIQ